jgi:hypothetical protein
VKNISLLIAALLVAPISPLAAQNRGAVRPAPKTSDGKPDFTGVYQGGSTKRGDWDFQVPSDQPGVPTAATQSISTSQARRDPVPFQPWAREKAQEILNLRSINDPTSRCLPGPSPRSHSVSLFPIQFVQTPKQIVILYEYFTGLSSDSSRSENASG